MRPFHSIAAMMGTAAPFRAAAFAFVALVGSQPASAQLDRVYDKSGDSIGGNVVSTTAKSIELKRGNDTQTVSAADIVHITFTGEPPALTKARNFVLDGQYEQGLAELKNVKKDQLKRAVVKADYQFYYVLCQAKLALAGKGDRKAAAGTTFQFAQANRNTWHFFETMKLLGDLALALNDHANALKYYGYLKGAPGPDLRGEATYLTGLANLKKGDLEKATAEFKQLTDTQPQTAAAVRLQILAKAGDAVALAMSGKGPEGLEQVKALINELDPRDTEMAARIYNAQGASYEASGDSEGAVLAYLHTHLMFASQPDAHAEALKRLVVLWEEIGKPSRAAEARQELQQRYPGS